ncbi:M13 family metallopeptidase [Kocuria marina]|uniref:M13 family metallopeptidase n=1 Tax=Kocuria marina TaxID=223184 RepID=UPI0019D0A216|nr:M13-type metalloendopeptidase [Kocuria indica]MBN6812956.1 peptidase M13 [Kocuria indica]MBN6844681.1 peptidase M13 [Kocuria indica]
MTTSVFDLDAFDRSVRPQDDLFRHVNGSWLKEARIPDDKASTGAFIELRDQAEQAVREIITGASAEGGAAASNPAEQSAETKIALLYASFMDTDRIEELATEPLREDLDAVAAIDSPRALSKWFGTAMRRGIGAALDIDLDSDPGDPQRNLVFVGQSGLGLPDEEYYREEQYAEIREKYVAHVAKMLELAGFEDAAEQAQAVMELETRIAAQHWDKVTVRDLTKMYNPMGFAELTDQVSRLDWDAVLEGMGLTPEHLSTVINAQPSFFTGLDELLTDDLLDAWKSWARWHVVSARAAYLPQAFVDQNFSFYGTVLSGTPQLRERWKRGVGLVNGALGEAVGELYVAENFSPSAKARMDELVANLLEAYRDSIEHLDWMTEDTRAEALKKLSGFTPKIGYPEKWKDYSGLLVRGDDLVGNVVRTAQFAVDELARKAGKPVEKHEWLMTPQTVNAYYHPLRNEIVFPAAILQPPFFNEDADDAVNYGAIGSVIGHEIGHGFDDKGSTCDGEGKLRNWWTDEDRAAFEQRTARLVGQYAALSPAQFVDDDAAPHVNGELTLGENIGDLGGLSIAYKAWKTAQEKKDRPDSESVDGYTPAQRLFISWAYVWQEKSRDEALKTRIATDPHSPAEFRAGQTPRNVDAFYEAFDVQDSDGMWLPEEERVAIW